MRQCWFTFCLALSIACASIVVRAHAPAATDAAPEPLPWRVGPAPLALGHGIHLDLPSAFQFLAQPQAGELMKKLGNLYNDDLLGLVIATTETGEAEDYLITLRYDEEGFVKDDEKLDGDALLKSMREGEEEYNDERKRQGFPPIHADGWQQVPRYDQTKHQVIWGLLLSNPNEPQAERSINFNTRVLGRKGYVSINLVTDPAQLERYKPAAASILASTRFVAGMRYEDFDAKNDKVAEYGLTGLVLGGVGLGLAKLAKVGLIAKFGKVIIAALLAGKKAIVAMLVAAAAAARRFFGRSKGRDLDQA